MPKIAYTGIILTEESRKKLLDKLKNIIFPNWKIYAHHLTLTLGELKNKSLIGKKVKLHLDKIGLSNLALAVSDSSFNLSNKKIPHITVAINEQKGGRPKDSNQITAWKNLKNPIEVEGVVKEVEIEKNEYPLTLNVFDFDGTLINTPDKNGKKEWENFYGKKFPYFGWWSKPESLDLKVFNPRAFSEIKNLVNKSKRTKNTITIILSARMEKLRPYIQEILKKNQINYDFLILKDDSWSSKGEFLLKLIYKYHPFVINVFDDRQKELDLFNAIIPKIPNYMRYNIFVVTNGKYQLYNANKKKNIDEIKYNYDDFEVIKNPNGTGEDFLRKKNQDTSMIRGKLLKKDEIPRYLYHISPYKNEIIKNKYLKAQKGFKGFGGGQIEGISCVSDFKLALKYYWGLLLSVLVVNTHNKEELKNVIEWWEKQQEKRGIPLNNIKKFDDTFWYEYNTRQKHLKNESHLSSAIQARKLAQIVMNHINDNIGDPIIFGEKQFIGIKPENVAIFMIDKNEILNDVPIITGTDTNEIIGTSFSISFLSIIKMKY